MIDTHHDILKLMECIWHFLDAGDDANHGAKLKHQFENPSESRSLEIPQIILENVLRKLLSVMRKEVTKM